MVKGKLQAAEWPTLSQRTRKDGAPASSWRNRAPDLVFGLGRSFRRFGRLTRFGRGRRDRNRYALVDLDGAVLQVQRHMRAAAVDRTRGGGAAVAVINFQLREIRLDYAVTRLCIHLE